MSIPPAHPPRPARPRRLDVYVAAHCPGCAEARRLAREAAGLPDLLVCVVDLDDGGGSPPPEELVAVPTYILDGRVIFLGNPTRQALFARLEVYP